MNRFIYSLCVFIAILLMGSNESHAGKPLVSALWIHPEEPTNCDEIEFGVTFGNEFEFPVNNLEVVAEVTDLSSNEVVWNYTHSKFDLPVKSSGEKSITFNQKFSPINFGSFRIGIEWNSPDNIDPVNNTYETNFDVAEGKIPLPTLTSHMDGETFSSFRPEFSFEPMVGKLIDFEFYKDIDLTNKLIFFTGLSNPTGKLNLDLSGVLFNQPVYTRFRATQPEKGKESDWSQTHEFFTPPGPRFESGTPAELDTIQSISQNKFVARYNPGFSDDTLGNYTSRVNIYNTNDSLLGTIEKGYSVEGIRLNGFNFHLRHSFNYRWSVQLYNSRRESEESPKINFFTPQFPPITGLTPAPGSIVDVKRPEIRFDTIGRAYEYHYQLDNNQQFSNPLNDEWISENFIIPGFDLLPGIKHYLRVRGVLYGDEPKYTQFGDWFTTDFTINLPESVEPLNNDNFKYKAYLSQNSDALILSYNLPVEAETGIEFFNLNGIKVHFVELGLQGTGENQTVILLDELENGVYLFRLQSGSAYDTGKFVIAR